MSHLGRIGPGKLISILHFSASFAVVGLLVDEERKEIYVYDEIYESRITDDERVALLQKHGWLKEPVHCDSNVPEELNELKRKGASRFFGVKKGPGSVTSGIQKIRGYRIIVHPRCENFIIEISHYQFRQDQFGKELPEPKKEWDHLMDAMRYAMTDDSVGTSVLMPPQDRALDERKKLERYIARRQGKSYK